MITYSLAAAVERPMIEEDFKRTLTGGWRITEPYSVSKDEGRYARQVAEEVKAIPRLKPKVPTHFNGKLIADLTPEERLEFFISMQQPSTQKTLRRDPKDDAQYIFDKANKPIDPSAQVRDADGNVDTGDRHLGIEEMLLVEDTRRKPKNSIGQGTKGSVDAEKRDRGIHAFTYSKPYDPSADELERLQKIKAVKATESAIPDFSPAKPEPKEYNPGTILRAIHWVQSWKIWWM